MGRSISDDFISQIDSMEVTPVIFLQLQFDDGNLNLWSGYYDTSFNGDLYVGSGNVLAVDRIEETQDFRATSVTFALNGLNSSVISAALTANYQGRPAVMWFAVLNSSNQVQASYQLFEGRMDVLTFSDNGDTADFAVKCESNLVDIRKVRERRYTPEDHKIDHEVDVGLEFTPKIQDIEIQWG